MRIGRERTKRYMRARLLLCAAVAAGGTLAVAAGAAHAHHAFSTFDMTTETVLEGTVVEFQWINPHTWTWLDVTHEDGSVTRWGLEGMNPSFLGRRGWNESTLEPGDRIQVAIYPLKSGAPGGTLLRATLADGTVKVMFGRAP